MKHEELFDRHLRGELTAAEAAELKHLLAGNADAGRAFVEYTAETAFLIRVGSQLEVSPQAENVVLLQLEGRVPISSAQRRSGPHGARPSIVKWLALAACLLALAIAAALFVPSPDRTLVAEARLTGLGVQVTRDGALLEANEIELQAGDVIVTPANEMAVIVYQREATRIEIKANSVVQVGDERTGKRLELRRGALQARVAPQPAGKPLLITTPQARATVLGTEFMLRADDRATKLNVLEGTVQLASLVNAEKVVVSAGFSATSTSSGTSDVKPLCKCSKCCGTNDTACSNLKKKNEK